LKFPAYINVGSNLNKMELTNIEQRIEFIQSDQQRRQKLKNILERFTKRPVFVFLNQKSEVDSIAEFLHSMKYKVSALHGGKS